jgi:hypothetical protein
LDNEALTLLRDQALLSWAVSRRQVLTQLENGSLDMDLMRQLLGGRNQEILAEMEAG